MLPQITSGIDASTKSGRLHLFDINGSCPAPYSSQALDLITNVDNSVLEVYVYGHFAMSTYVRYPRYAEFTEIHFFHNGKGEVPYSNIRVVDGLYYSYPGRAQ
ncbi:uncharacterized protein EURHEDRAFT_552240 [Aspergillus ruber CBS 135680]